MSGSSIDSDMELNSVTSNASVQRQSKTVDVRDVIDKDYFIPAYQRGYRWEKEQVNRLIDDLYNFAEMENTEGKSDDFYCLQSLVIKRNAENKFEVIDGQQRLTTMYILFSYLYDEMPFKPEEKVSLGTIEYQTREDTWNFLQNLKDTPKNEHKNITKIDLSDKKIIKCRDIKFIADAFNTIRDHNKVKESTEWLRDLIKNGKIRFLFQDYSRESFDVNEIFDALNTGKIPLTDAELIRARALLTAPDDEKDRIAKKWDDIEHRLQDDSFWFFIQNKQNDTASRIGCIFRIVVNEIIKQRGISSFDEESNHSLYRFLSEHRLDDGRKGEDEKPLDGSSFEGPDCVEVFWKEVKRVYEVINKWYCDVELYNYVGQVLYFSDDNEKINELLENYKTRYGFIEYLKKEILCLMTRSDVKLYSKTEDIRKALGIDNNGDPLTVFKELWFSGRPEPKTDDDSDEAKDIRKELTQRKPNVHVFLLWSNCEYLNKQLRNASFEAARSNKLRTIEKQNVRDEIAFSGKLQTESYRFPFEIYKLNKPDIEHVDSYLNQDEDEGFFEDKKKCDEWIKTVLGVVTDDEQKKIRAWVSNANNIADTKDQDVIKKNLKKCFDAVKDEDSKNWEMFPGTLSDRYPDFINFLKDEIFEQSLPKNKLEDKAFKKGEPDRRRIGNLTILDPNINRGYKNFPFRVKRRDVIEKSLAGRYVYPCTRLVFLKEFDPTTSNLTAWNVNDYNNYRNYLIALFYDCFFVDSQETDHRINEKMNEALKGKKPQDALRKLKLKDIDFAYLDDIIGSEEKNQTGV